MNTTPVDPVPLTPQREFPRRGPSRFLFVLACLITLIAVFYAEENWRGKRVWQKYRHKLEAQGYSLNWADYVPPRVPDEQNAFKAPKMEEWFVKGPSNSSVKFSDNYPLARIPTTNVAIQVAELSVLPEAGPNPEKADAVLDLDAPLAREQAQRLIENAVGPVVNGAQSIMLFLRPFDQIKPARILLKTDSMPSVKEVAAFLGDKLPNCADSRLRVESSGTNTFRVSVNSSWCTAADYLAWSNPLEADFDVMREALKRPFARMEGDYGEPVHMPIPGFVRLRQVVQILSQRAQCYLLLGKPEAALGELTLVRELCRLLEAKPTGKPMTLVAAMINVAITGLYTSILADGLRLQTWREPELAALEDQLKQIHLLPILAEAFESERAFACVHLETTSRGELANWLTFWPKQSSLWEKIRNPRFLFFRSVPRGWIYQNLAAIAFLDQKWIDAQASTKNLLLPHALANLGGEIQTTFGHFSPYTFLAARAVPNFYKATQTLARNQTLVDQALTACALERYRLSHGQYPETLDALTPQFLKEVPRDIIGGQPLKYRRTEGDYVLYSVGWNETDDGGTPEKDWLLAYKSH